MAVLYRTERALGRLRGGVRRRRDPVPGRGAPRARRGAPAAEGAAADAQRARRATRVRRVALEQGLLDALPQRLGEREETRQNDLAPARRAGRELDDGDRRGVRRRASRALRERRRPAACTCSRYHRAKGLEFEAVFLPRLEERELPVEAREDRRRDRRGAAAASTSASRVRSGTSRSRGRRSRAASSPSSASDAGAAPVVEPDDPLLDVAQALAARAREGGGQARVRRLPRLDARRDRGAAAARASRSSAPSPASARRSSSATATTCSPPSPPGPERSPAAIGGTESHAPGSRMSSISCPASRM